MPHAQAIRRLDERRGAEGAGVELREDLDAEAKGTDDHVRPSIVGDVSDRDRLESV